MRLWNLSTLDDLEEPVLLRNTGVETQREQIRRASSKSRSLGFVVRVAALAAATLAVTATGSCKTLAVPNSSAFVAANASYDEPPLERHFSNRFSHQWTKEHENELLTRMIEKKGVQKSDEALLNVVDSSQQESLSSEVPRLAKKDVLVVLRRKA